MVSLDRIIEYENKRREHGYQVLWGEMSSQLFMNIYCIDRDVCASFLRQYRRELKEYDHLGAAYK